MQQRSDFFKLILFLSLFCYSPLIWSHGYLGLGAGPQAVDFNQNVRFTTPINIVHDNSHLSGTGVFGSIFGGYAWIQQSFYLAGEASLDVSNVLHQRSNEDFTHKTVANLHYRMPYILGLNILPGYLFTASTLFYARLGYALSYLKISSSDVSIPNINKNLSGISFGLGLNQALTQQIAVRVEYQQVNYLSTNSNWISPTGLITKNTNIAPISQQVEFAVLYNFA
jgi:outer membrane immunogenic protein